MSPKTGISEVIPLYFENHTNSLNTLCDQTAAHSTCTNRCYLKG